MIPTFHGKPELSIVPLVDLFSSSGGFRSSKEDGLPYSWRFHLTKNDNKELIDADWLLFLITPDDSLQLLMKMWVGVSPYAGKFLYGLFGRAQLLVFYNPKRVKTPPLTVYISARGVDEWEICQEEFTSLEDD